MDLAFILFLDICSRLPLTAGTTLDCATMTSVKREDVCYVITTLGNKSLHVAYPEGDLTLSSMFQATRTTWSKLDENDFFSRSHAKFDVHVLLNTDAEKPVDFFRFATSSNI